MSYNTEGWEDPYNEVEKEPEEDIVRVVRVIEYVGKRSRVEQAVRDSVCGEKFYRGLMVKAATLGTFPEIMNQAIEVELVKRKLLENQRNLFENEESAANNAKTGTFQGISRMPKVVKK